MSSKLRSFVRVDASGRIISGSNIARKSKPKIGKWREITPANECCFPGTSLTYDIADVGLTNMKLTLLCDAAEVLAITTGSTTTTLDEVVAALNDKAGYVGLFGQSAGDVTLVVRQEVATDLCSAGTLTFTVTEA